MRACGLRQIIVSNPASVFYLTGVWCEPFERMLALLLTDDGEFAHRLLSPKSEIDKVYLAEVEGRPTEEDVRRFAEGLVLGDGTVCLPAKLEILDDGRAEVTVHEGKYHQVRRMLAAVGKPVLELRRIRVGGLALDPGPGSGRYAELNPADLCILFRELHMEK